MKINIKGTIVSSEDKWIYEWFGIEATCPKDVENTLEKANGEDVEVIINSGGGSVFAGSEIYWLLKDYKAKKTGKIVGIAGSIASVIAMSVDELLMAPTAQIMIHNVSSSNHGDYRTFEHEAQVLKDYNSTISNAYMIKTGMSKEELLAMMDKETWLTPERALENKFIDKIMFMENQLNLVASTGTTNMLPKEVLDKLRNQLRAGDFNKENFKNQINTLNLVNQIENKEEDGNMTFEEFKNNNPELFNQITEEAYKNGVEDERKRIQNIEEVAPVGYEKLVADAKFEKPITAEALAVNIIKAQKQVGIQFLNSAKSDAEELEGLETSNGDESKENKKAEEVNSLTAALNKKRGDR